MDDGRQVVFGFDDVFHIPGLGYNGLCGFSPIRMAMEAVGLGLAAEAFGGEFFGNGTNVGAVVTTDKVLSDKAFEHLKGSLQEKYEGLGKAHKLMLLEEGMKFARNVIPPNEAQFLETRRFQRNEIASIYRVPPHMIADLERATFSNIENQDIGFVKHTMLSWFRRWESFAQLKLFTPRERKAFFAEFSVDGLLRGDSTARAAFYKEMFMLGAYSQNDIRAKENDNPIDGGDRYWVPLNMVPIDKVDEVLAGKILPKGGDPNNAG
jgi:HK97 family phage portal protein